MVLKVLVLETKLFLREKTAVFFTFLFPLFLLFLFGSIWGRTGKFFGYLVPMLLAMVTFSGALYSVGLVLTSYRESGILKRIALTPLKPRTYIYGVIGCRFLIVYLQGLLLIAISALVLNLDVQGGYASLFLFLAVGILSLLAVGGVVAGISKNMAVANAIAKFAFLPLMFLSGAFIPITAFPEFLQQAAVINPIHHFIKGLQNIIIEGRTIIDELPRLAILLALLMASFLISRRTILAGKE